MKLLIDMNLSPKLANMLVAENVESVHWSMISGWDAKDSEIFNYAIQNDYIVVTCDLDFSTMLSMTSGCKPSIIQIRIQNVSWTELAEVINKSIKQCTNELESGAILTIDAKKLRLRLLPL